MAFVVAPELPLDAWFKALDAQMYRSPGFFDARPVVIDLAGIPADAPGAATLISDLEARGLGVIDVENPGSIPGTDPWRSRLVGGRDTGDVDMVASELASAEAAAATPNAQGLILPEPVRSGQTVAHLKGDVTVVGHVSSGAEVMASGSIHVYGTLRGRAIAGAFGASHSRIFCQRLEAELVSIDGFYLTADSMDPALRGRAVEIALVGEALVITPLA